MKIRYAVGLASVFLAAFGSSAVASDWADSREVIERLEQLRARPGKPKTLKPGMVEDNVTTEAAAKPVKAWKNIDYGMISPAQPPRKEPHVQQREIAVAEADKLGYQLNNAGMRDKVLELYRRPDIVVKQYVIGQ